MEPINKEIINNINSDNVLTIKEDDIFALRSNKMTIHLLNNQKVDDHEKKNVLLKQSSLLNYLVPMKKAKNSNINKNINNEIVTPPVDELNENDEENDTSTSSVTTVITSQQQNNNIILSSKRDLKNNQSTLTTSNDEPPTKKKILELKLTEKEKKILKHVKFEEKIGIYRNFDRIPLPEIYIQEKNKITLDQFVKEQLKKFINNISYNPISDLEANTDFLLEEETDETFTDLYVPIDEASPETPFADCQYILDMVKDKYLKKK